MDNLLAYAKADSAGKQTIPHQSHSKVQDYIDAVGYGGIEKGEFNDELPSSVWKSSSDFAIYLQEEGVAERLGWKDISDGNLWHAPPGSIVFIAAGAPYDYVSNTGDISVMGEDGQVLFNGGEQYYDMAGESTQGYNLSEYTMGVYVPIKCSVQNSTYGNYYYESMDNDAQNINQTPEHSWDEHSSLIQEISQAGQAIESIRQSEIERTGMDPLAFELLP